MVVQFAGIRRITHLAFSRSKCCITGSIAASGVASGRRSIGEHDEPSREKEREREREREPTEFSVSALDELVELN